MYKKTSRYISALILLIFSFVSIIYQPAYALTGQGQANSNNSSQAKAYRQKNAKRLTELKEKRDQHTKYYLNSDGTTTAEIAASSRHYKDKDDKWQDISNKIVTSKEPNFDFRNEANIFKTHFARNSAAQNLFMLKLEPGLMISWNLADANKVEAVADTNSVTYPDILSNSDLQYVPYSDGLKENIILKSKDAPNSFKFNMKTTGLKPVAQSDGSIALQDAKSGEVKLVLPKPFMFDSKQQYSQDVSMTIEQTQSPNEYTVIITADLNWLADSSRTYPITIDPAITTQDVYNKNDYTPVTTNGVDTYIAEGTNYSYYNNEFVTTGYENGTYQLKTTRALIKFPISSTSIPAGAIVTDAVLSLYKYTTSNVSTETLLARRITSDWQKTVTWGNKPTVDDTYTETQASMADVGGSFKGWVNFNVWSIVKGWINGGLPNYGFMVQHNVESNPLFFYYSSESPTGNGPLLSLTYITEQIGLNPYWAYANTEVGSVNTLNGNLITSVADFSLPGRGMPININRTYNSRGNLRGIFGEKWFSNLDMQLLFPSWGAILVDSAGTERPFMLKSDGLTYIAPDNYPMQLYKDTSGGTTVYRVQEASTDTSTYQTKLPTLTFNSAGKLIQIDDGKGNPTIIAWGADNILITDPSGRTATLSLNADGTVSQITTSVESGKVKASYTYNSGYLTSVTYDNGSYPSATVNYEWKSGLLSSLTDKNGTKKYINYNSSNQVVSVGTLNMLSNPGLEAGPGDGTLDNWTLVVSNDNGTVNQGTTSKYGKNGLTIKSVSKSGTTGMSYLYGYQDVPVKPGTAYTYSSYIKTNGLAGNAFIQIEQLDASGNHISWTDTRVPGITGTTDWTKKTITLTTAANTATVRLYLEIDHDVNHFGGEAYFDGAQFVLGSTDASSFEGHTDFRYGTDGGFKAAWITSPTGELVEVKNDNYGTPVAVIKDPRDTNPKSETQMDWDASDRLRSLTNPVQVQANSGKKYSYEYDAVGNMTKSTDPLGRTTSMDYYYNLLSKLTQADGNTVENVWDPVNLNKDTDIDQTLNSKAYSYDLGNTTLESNLVGVADNRILNSSFEELNGDQPVNWTAQSPAGTLVNKVEYDSIKESNVLHVNTGTSYYAYQWQTDYINLNTNGVPDYFTISGDVKAGQLGSAEGPALRIVWYKEVVDQYGAKTYSYLSDHKIPNIRSTEWQRYVDTVQSPQGATHAKVQAVVYGGNNNGYFDNIQLEKSQLSRGYNFIENSSFEKGDLKWTVDSYSSIVNAPGGYSGDYYGKISLPSTGSSYLQTQTVLPVKSGQVYTLLGYIKTEGIVVGTGNGGAFLYADYYDSSGGYLGNASTEYITDTSGWTKYALVLAPPANSASVKILLRMYNAKGTAYFDNIRLSPGRLAVTNSYDANKNYVTSTSGQMQNTVSFQNDAYGSTTQVTAPGGEIIKYSYDGQGRLRTVIDNANNTATYDLDANGNVKSIVLKEGAKNYNSTSFTYDSHNNIKTETDANNNTTTYSYDEGGRIANKTNPNGTTVSTGYDSYGNSNQVALSGSPTYNYSYDLEGRVTTSTISGGSSMQYQYDEVGNLVSQMQKDASNNTITTIGAPATGMYSPLDQLLGFKLTHKGYTANPIDFIYDYTKSGLVNSVTGSGKSFSFNYDEGNSLVARKNPNNTRDNFTYNDAKKITGIQTVDNNNNVKWSSRFQYDSDGRITQITGNGPGSPSATYTYNNGTEKLNRLTNAVINDGTNNYTFNYSYDAAGNILNMDVANGNGTTSTVAFSYDADNRITGNTDFAYDNNGNLTKAKLKGTVYQYVYDAANRLIEVKDGSGANISSYTYDAEGRRLTKTANGETITYHYFGGQLLYETSSADAADVLRALYLRSPQGKLLAVSPNYRIGSTNSFYYYHYNGHGDVTAVTDSNGNVYRQYVYDPYGNVISVKDGSGNTVDVNNDPGFENAYTYAGYRYDKESGLYFLNARYHAPEI